MEIKRRFFKSKERAKAFCAEVHGNLHSKSKDWKYEIILSTIDYPEGLEDFEYLVEWFEN